MYLTSGYTMVGGGEVVRWRATTCTATATQRQVGCSRERLRDRGFPAALATASGGGRGIHFAGRAAGRRRPTGCRAQPVWLGSQVCSEILAAGVHRLRRRRPSRNGSGAYPRRPFFEFNPCSRWWIRCGDRAGMPRVQSGAGQRFATPLLQQGFPLGSTWWCTGTAAVDGQVGAGGHFR